MGWRFAFRAKLFWNLQTVHTVSVKSVVQGLYSYWRYKFYGVIRWGSVKTERQVGELYSQLSDMLFTDVYRK